MKTKEEVLHKHKYEKITGYCFDACPAENECETFVEQDEVDRVYKAGPKTFWWDEGNEYMRDLNDMWEVFYEEHCCANDLDITLEEFDKLMDVI